MMMHTTSRRGRALLAATATTALSVTLLAPPTHAVAPTPAAGSAVAVPQAPWSACRDGFQCATVPAPLDYDHPHGAQIAISVIRLPAAEPRRRLGPLLFTPGGPGGWGIALVRAVAKFLPLELRARFDIVGFDPRGIRRSTPLRCFDTF